MISKRIIWIIFKTHEAVKSIEIDTGKNGSDTGAKRRGTEITEKGELFSLADAGARIASAVFYGLASGRGGGRALIV